MCIYTFLSLFVLRFEPMLIGFISFTLATFATTQKKNKKYPSLTSGEGDLLRWLDWWKYPLKKIKRRRVDLKFRKTLERYIQSSQMKIYWFLITKKKDSWQHWYNLIVLVPSSFHIVFFFIGLFPRCWGLYSQNSMFRHYAIYHTPFRFGKIFITYLFFI